MPYIIIVIILFFTFFYKQEVINEIKYVNRKTSTIETEKVAGEFYLKWLYYNPIGKISAKAIIKNRFVSEYYGKQMDKPKSKFKIPDFINKFGINLDESEKQYFDSFNDFFVRKLKNESRIIDLNEKTAVSPADGKILAFENIEETDSFFVKGKKFNLKTFFMNNEIYKKYEKASMLIIRLCPTDYHRYHFPVNGYVNADIKIDGNYYSVSPYAVKHNIDIYFNNKRSYSLINTDNFGDVVMAEIGATMVGAIIQTYQENSFIKKGEEKGFFKFGGSTVILFFEKGKIKIDSDLLSNSKKGLETQIYMGERIGEII
ncbi:MAG: phosphatidylserine decarboxylase [Fusobacteriaceae bacterium]|nr:phosphatidylserine decarboxylase [Fusobacteriaceae bacterium]